jgi:hypothetical protein
MATIIGRSDGFKEIPIGIAAGGFSLRLAPVLTAVWRLNPEEPVYIKRSLNGCPF